MSSQVSSPQFVTKSATSANQFIESIGVNTHLSSRGSPYANISLVKASLDYLGVDNIRDNVTTSTLGQSSFNELAAAGYKFDLVLTTASNGTVDIAGFMAALKSDLAQYQGSISAIEGPNEVNNAMISLDGTTKSIAAAAVVQQELFTAVNADAALANISIYNTTVGSTNTSQFAQLGNLSAYTDYANEHAYVMSTSNISAGLDYLLSFSAISAPGKPAVITEAGYTTLTSVWYNGVSETVQAKYTLDTLMDAYQKGVPETYLYELLDESQFGSNSSQSHFGLFHADGSPKLAATAIHNLTAILQDTGPSANTASGSLTYALSGTPTTSHDMVFAKSNGKVDLVLWAEPVLWNQSTQSSVAATPSPVTVTFAQTESLVKVYDPLLGSTPIATYANVSSIQVTLSDHPLVIEVTPVNHSTSSAGASIQTYAAGALASETTTFAAGSADLSDVKNYTAGALTRETVVHGDNSTDVYIYNVKNQNYVSEHDSFDATGVLTSTIRSHADGTFAYAYNTSADGTKITDQYNSAGIIVSDSVIHADGSSDVKTYSNGVIAGETIKYAAGSTASSDVLTFTNGALASELIKYTTGFADAFENKTYNAGILNRDDTVHRDNSEDVYYNVQNQTYVSGHDVYNAARILTSVTRIHTDGSPAYTYQLASDGTKTTDQYDAAGHLVSDSVVHADGSSENKTYVNGALTVDTVRYAAGSADISDTKAYTTSVLTNDTVVHADKSKDVYDSNIVGKSYIADHFRYDSTGKLAWSDQTNTDGSHNLTAYNSGYSLTSTMGVTDQFTSSSTGGDTFVFKPSSGNDIIVGFHAGNFANHDTIVIDSSIVNDFSHLAMQQVGHDTLLTLDAHDAILIKNVSPSALTSTDFQFVHHDWALS
jgi:hypothetical protein